MKRFALSIAVITAIGLAGAAWAREDKTEPQLRLELDLIDGSRIIGTASIESVPVQTTYAKMDVPLKQIRTIKMDDDHETGAVGLQNGDQIKGVISLEPIRLETLFGKVAIGFEHIKQFNVVLSGGTRQQQLDVDTTTILDGDATEWTFTGPSANKVVLHLEAHVKWSQLAGSACIMDLKVNGLAIPKNALVNKPMQFTFADGRSSNYYGELPEEREVWWQVFYSPEFGDNDSGTSGYAVLEKMSCVYEFDITALVKPGQTYKITLRNRGEKAHQKLGQSLPIMCRDVRLILW